MSDLAHDLALLQQARDATERELEFDAFESASQCRHRERVIEKRIVDRLMWTRGTA